MARSFDELMDRADARIESALGQHVEFEHAGTTVTLWAVVDKSAEALRLRNATLQRLKMHTCVVELRDSQLPVRSDQFSQLAVAIDGVRYKVADHDNDGGWQLLALVEIATGDNKTTQSSFIKAT